MSPHAETLLRRLRQGVGWFYCRPCLSKGVGVAVNDLRIAWAELVAHKTVELNQAPCVVCLQPRTIVRIRPGNY
jgi:hypothetical protein